MGLHALATTYGMPTTIEEKNATPCVETGRHQGIIAAKQIAPAEVGTFEQIDLAHDEIS